MSSEYEKRQINLSVLLQDMLSKKASDLHLTPGIPPQLRIDGEIHQLNYPSLNKEDTQYLAFEILTENQKQKLEKQMTADGHK